MTKETDTVRYIWKRTKRLWPHLFLSYLIIYLFSFRGNIIETIRQMLIGIGESSPFTYFFFDCDYAGRFALNYPAWYITSLMICSMAIHYLYMKHKKCFVSVVAPVSALLIYGYIYRTAPNLNVGREVAIFLNDYLLRGFAGMSVGVMCYYILEQVKELKFTLFFYWVMRALELISMILFSVFALKYGEQKTDMALLVVLYIGTFCSFVYPARRGSESNVYDIAHKAVRTISSYTYACYLNHVFVGMFIQSVSQRMPVLNHLISYYLVLIAMSVLTQNILTILGKQCGKLSRVFVVN